MTVRLGRVVLLVSDQDRALDFWTSAFGCHVLADQPGPDGRRYLHVGFPGAPEGIGAPGLWLLAVPPDHPRLGSQTGGEPLLVLYVDELDATVSRAVSAGARLVAGPDSDTSTRYAHLADPVGNVIVCVAFVVSARTAAEIDALRQALCAATYRGDGAQAVASLTASQPDLLLQHAGSALLLAFTQGVEGTAPIATRVIEALARRDWPGDRELAECLEAAGHGRGSGRPAVPVELDELCELMEGDLNMGPGGLLDLVTGETWPHALLDDGGRSDGAPDADEDPDRWLDVPHLGSRDAWRDMRNFADDEVRGPAHQQLSAAIEGRGAFSRFRSTLEHFPDLEPLWLAYQTERRMGRARAWLTLAGCDAMPLRRQ